jgi:hypothetical protein
MKKVQAIVPEARIGPIVERLLLVGVDEVFVSDVYAATAGAEPQVFRGHRSGGALSRRALFEWWGSDAQVECVVRAIRQASGEDAAPGAILVTELEEI